MKRVVIYLRKSRADIEAESRGEGETLTKHRKTLLKLAKEKNLNIVKIYEEIVSGESLMHRPEMLELLKDVENKKYDAVLVMDVDRLGRGNMQEQGLILETFKKSGTKIITPRKIYNLDDEFDEEYSEFEAFMARKELKMINRRLQRGRVRSIEDGNYISPNPPYGYEIDEGKDYRTLKPHPEQSEVVKMIFEWYVNGLGSAKIANKLNELSYKTYTGINWRSYSVLNVIKNLVYTGKVVWKKKDIKKSKEIGKVKDTVTRPKNEWIIADGKHPALVSEDLFEKAQEILNRRYHVPYQLENKITNPLAGLIRCKVCGASMVLRPYKNKDNQMMCYNACGNKSSKVKFVERELLAGLEKWSAHYKAQWNLNEEKIDVESDITSSIALYKKAVEKLEKELEELESQKNNLHDLLERGIYDVDTYLERSNNLVTRIGSTKENINKAKLNLNQEVQRHKAQIDIIPKIEKVLDLYPKLDDPGQKNKLLKTILDYCEYYKEKSQRNDNFSLRLFPKLPKETLNS